MNLFRSQNIVMCDVQYYVRFGFPRILAIVYLQLHKAFGELVHTYDQSLYTQSHITHGRYRILPKSYPLKMVRFPQP